MRVISGSARGMRLKRVPGDTTRPAMDRVKENLFNILKDDYVIDCRWLDLFGGTGQIGIEALSRGAEHVLFTDSVRAAIETIRGNLVHTKLTDGGTVRRSDAFSYLDTTRESFDVIYIAPPQYKAMWVSAITGVDLRVNELLTEGGIAIVQIDPKEYSELDLKNLEMYDKRKYGTTMLCFYQKKEVKEASTEETE